MYIYEKKDNSLEIYNLIPQEEKLYKYRVEQMKKIPEDRMVFRGITGIGINNYQIFKNYENRFDAEIIPIENADGKFHKLEPDPIIGTGVAKEKLLDSYYLGHLKDKSIARIWDLKALRYFLLNQTNYTYHSGKIILGEIIEIPEALYLLSLIEQEKFSLIGDKNIFEQLSLFKLQQAKAIDLEMIEKIDLVGIAPGCYSRTIKKIENDAHILKLIKK